MAASDKTLKQLYFDSIIQEDIEKVKSCINLGVNINATDEEDEKTPALIYAMENYEIVELLLSQPNIDVNVKDEYGNTGFMMACWKGYPDIVRRLSYVPGIELNCQDEEGNTPAICSVLDGQEECVKVLR